MVVLLLDEPFGSLDQLLRQRLINELRPMLDQAGVTAVHVTHDHHETFALADHIAVMANGRLLRVGTPERIWTDPRTPQEARLLGHTNIIDTNTAEPLARAARREHRFVLRSDRIEANTASSDDNSGNGGVSAADGPVVQLRAKVNQRRFHGDRYELRLKTNADDESIPLDTLTPHAPPTGADVTVRIRPDAVIPLET